MRRSLIALALFAFARAEDTPEPVRSTDLFKANGNGAKFPLQPYVFGGFKRTHGNHDWCGPFGGEYGLMIDTLNECKQAANVFGFSSVKLAGPEWYAGCIVNHGQVYFVAYDSQHEGSTITHKKAVDQGGYLCLNPDARDHGAFQMLETCKPGSKVTTAEECALAARGLGFVSTNAAGTDDWEDGCILNYGNAYWVEPRGDGTDQKNAQCGDTAHWRNPNFGCHDYLNNGWCSGNGAGAGNEWTLGGDFRHPEDNCCGCRKNTHNGGSICRLCVAADQDACGVCFGDGSSCAPAPTPEPPAPAPEAHACAKYKKVAKDGWAVKDCREYANNYIYKGSADGKARKKENWCNGHKKGREFAARCPGFCCLFAHQDPPYSHEKPELCPIKKGAGGC